MVSLGPVVESLPSNSGGVGLIFGQGAKIPHTLQQKKKNTKTKPKINASNIVRYSVKTLRMFHINKKIF